MTLLAMQAAGSTAQKYSKTMFLKFANAPGKKIYPGELADGLRILKNGGKIDYVGATNVELIGAGESAGSYREVLVKDQKTRQFDTDSLWSEQRLGLKLVPSLFAQKL